MERVEMVTRRKEIVHICMAATVHSPIFSGRVPLIGKSQWSQGEMEKKVRKYA